MDKNLRMRLIVGFGLFFVALVALYTFDAIPFKVIFGLFAFVAAIELFSFFEYCAYGNGTHLFDLRINICSKN